MPRSPSAAKTTTTLRLTLEGQAGRTSAPGPPLPRRRPPRQRAVGVDRAVVTPWSITSRSHLVADWMLLMSTGTPHSDPRASWRRGWAGRTGCGLSRAAVRPADPIIERDVRERCPSTPRAAAGQGFKAGGGTEHVPLNRAALPSRLSPFVGCLAVVAVVVCCPTPDWIRSEDARPCGAFLLALLAAPQVKIPVRLFARYALPPPSPVPLIPLS